MATITVKLLIDKEKNRVVFAESDKDFVDILFGFLTLPMGTIIRVLNKQSSLGSMDKLYESVETLETKNLETEACKSMLLQPRCSAEKLCEDLPINVDDSKPWRIYICQSFDCAKNYRHYSSVSGARCSCGKLMDKSLQCYLKRKGDVFLKGEGKYIISDDLHVFTASIDSTLSLLRKLGIKDADNLEKRVVDVRRDEVLALLKRSFQSKTPLSDVFLRKPTLFSRDKPEAKVSDATQINLGDENESTDQTKTISIKLLQNKVTNEIIYVEAGQDLVDILFSFLTFPLGSIVKLLNKHSLIRCIDNLYESVEIMGIGGNDRIKHQETQNMLLAPMLSPHFTCSTQIIRIEEQNSHKYTVKECETCWNGSQLNKCKHEANVLELTEINPKLRKPGKDQGGGYAKASAKFMVTHEMVVVPFSPVYGVDVIKELKTPVGLLMEKEVSIGEAEALNLLKACLISRNALNNVFAPKAPKKVTVSA